MFTSIIAHANHPELFFAGLAVGVVLTAAHFAWQRVRK